MNCEEYRDLLEGALDGDITAEERALLRRHEAECPDCAAWRRKLEQVQADLRALGEEIPEPPAELHDRWMDEIRPRQKDSRRLTRWLATAVAAVIVVGGAVWARGRIDAPNVLRATAAPQLEQAKAAARPTGEPTALPTPQPTTVPANGFMAMESAETAETAEMEEAWEADTSWADSWAPAEVEYAMEAAEEPAFAGNMIAMEAAPAWEDEEPAAEEAYVEEAAEEAAAEETAAEEAVDAGESAGWTIRLRAKQGAAELPRLLRQAEACGAEILDSRTQPDGSVRVSLTVPAGSVPALLDGFEPLDPLPESAEPAETLALTLILETEN